MSVKVVSLKKPLSLGPWSDLLGFRLVELGERRGLLRMDWSPEASKAAFAGAALVALAETCAGAGTLFLAAEGSRCITQELRAKLSSRPEWASALAESELVYREGENFRWKVQVRDEATGDLLAWVEVQMIRKPPKKEGASRTAVKKR